MCNICKKQRISMWSQDSIKICVIYVRNSASLRDHRTASVYVYYYVPLVGSWSLKVWTMWLWAQISNLTVVNFHCQKNPILLAIWIGTMHFKWANNKGRKPSEKYSQSIAIWQCKTSNSKYKRTIYQTAQNKCFIYFHPELKLISSLYK